MYVRPKGSKRVDMFSLRGVKRAFKPHFIYYRMSELRRGVWSLRIAPRSTVNKICCHQNASWRFGEENEAFLFEPRHPKTVLMLTSVLWAKIIQRSRSQISLWAGSFGSQRFSFNCSFVKESLRVSYWDIWDLFVSLPWRLELSHQFKQIYCAKFCVFIILTVCHRLT